MEDDRIVISSGPTLTPESVVSRTFATGFRGYDQDEVRGFLKRVADELSMVAAREVQIRESMQDALHRAAHPQLDEEALTAALGEHAARLLTNARDAAVNIVSEAETRAARIIGEAESKIARVRAEADSLLARRSEEAERLTGGLRQAVEADARSQRERAKAEAEAEVESARTQGREMIAEARSLRERMLADLARRRRVAEVQIEQLRLARQRLLEAYGVVRRTLDEATSELAAAEADAQPALAAAAYERAPAEGSTTSGSPPPSHAGPQPAARVPTSARGGNASSGGSGSSGSQRKAAGTGAGGGSTGAVPRREPPAPVTAVTAVRPLASVPPPAKHGGPASRGLVRPGPTSPGSLSAVPSHAPDDGAVEGPSAENAAHVAPVARAVPDLAASDAAVATDPLSPPEPPASGSSPVAQVDELFARMRAGQPGATATPSRGADDEPSAAPGPVPSPERAGEPLATTPRPAGTAGSTGPAVAAGAAGAAGAGVGPSGPGGTSAAVIDESALSRRDERLDPLGGDLVRQLKRVLQDEHNEVLDRLRQQRLAVPDAVLPAAAAQRERFSAAALPLLAESARLGAESVGGEVADRGLSAREIDQWAAELATDLVVPLRDRLERALGDVSSVGDQESGPALRATPDSSAADRISAGYRQWKSQEIEPVARHHVVRAYCRGAFMATPDGANLRWLLDDDGPCPDCDDNVLAGTQVKGQAFPTGQLHPPAHMGCRCLLAVISP